VTLVSIVTPTIPGREALLLERCMPSVAALEWPGPVEHVIVSDPNPILSVRMDVLAADRLGGRRLRFVELGANWRNPTTEASTGGVPWMIGSYLALGEFVGFCGDDDELLPHHVRTHVDAMRAAEALWSVSQVDFRIGGEPWCVIGDDTYQLGHLDSTGIMCHADALSVARWNPNGQDATDWQMVNDWRTAGLRGVFIPEVTGIHHDGWAAGKSGKP